jgi:hypothetical protein
LEKSSVRIASDHEILTQKNLRIFLTGHQWCFLTKDRCIREEEILDEIRPGSFANLQDWRFARCAPQVE